MVWTEVPLGGVTKVNLGQDGFSFGGGVGVCDGTGAGIEAGCAQLPTSKTPITKTATKIKNTLFNICSSFENIIPAYY